MANRTKFIIFIAVLFVLGTAGWIAMNQIDTESYQGYFSPVFSPDGKEIYFVIRETAGITWGQGIEFFTPPAHAFIFKDNLSLRKINIESGKIEIIKKWPSSPLKFQTIQNYRGSIFGIINGELRFLDQNRLEYVVGGFSAPAKSGYQSLFVSNLWDNVQNKMVEKDNWYAGWVGSGGSEWPIYEELEVIALPGNAMYPSALALYNSKVLSVRVLLKSKDFNKIYPNGITAQEISKFSNRLDVERTQELRKKYAELLGKYQREGFSEAEALLKTGKDFENLGYYPKSTTIIAKILTNSEISSLRSKNNLSPVFVISKAELESGIFPDIAKAIAEPGSSIDKANGGYTIHRDYSNSQKLNEFIDSGGTLFYIEYFNAIYELKINK